MFLRSDGSYSLDHPQRGLRWGGRSLQRGQVVGGREGGDVTYRKPWVESPAWSTHGVIVPACNSHSREEETRGLKVPGYPWLQSDFKVRPGLQETSLKK